MATPFRFKNFFSLFHKCFNGQNNPEVIQLITNIEEVPDGATVSRVIKKGQIAPKSWCVPVLSEGTTQLVSRFEAMSENEPRQLYVEMLDDCVLEFISQIKNKRYSDTKQILNMILSAAKTTQEHDSIEEKIKLLTAIESKYTLVALLQAAMINELSSKKNPEPEQLYQEQHQTPPISEHFSKKHFLDIKDSEEIPLSDSDFLNWVNANYDISEVYMAFHVGADWWTNDSKRSALLKLCNNPTVSIRVLSNPEYVSNYMLENMKQADKVYLKTDDILQVWNERSNRYSNLLHRSCSVPILHRMIIVRCKNGDGICKVTDYVYGNISRKKHTRRIYHSTHQHFHTFLEEFLYLWENTSMKYENIQKTNDITLLSTLNVKKGRHRGYSLLQNYDFHFFEGEYYCYYYSIRNNGSILGGKLFFYSEGQQLKAKLVLGCQNDEQFDNIPMQTFFDTPNEKSKVLFHDYQSKLGTREKNIYYYYGDCSFNKNTIYIEFKTSETDCVSLLWGVSIPLDSNQSQYRGGMGIAVTKNGASTFRFFKIGFSRHKFSLHDDHLKSLLKVNLNTLYPYRSDENITVKEDEDINWYRFIIDNETQ